MNKVSISLAVLLALSISALPRTQAQNNAKPAQPNISSMVHRSFLKYKFLFVNPDAFFVKSTS